MAKPRGQLNGASSQWFINLKNNATSLDQQIFKAATHAVFGEVIDDGMAVVDAIAALETCNTGDPDGQIPMLTIGQLRYYCYSGTRELCHHQLDYCLRQRKYR